MTRTEVKKRRRGIPAFLLFLLLFFLSLCMSAEVSRAILEGLRLALGIVIPSLFPATVLSALIASRSDFLSNTRAARLFSKFFHLPAAAFPAFLLGSLFGFPLGAKTVAMLVEDHVLEKEDARFLVGFSNNTGPAFLIGGIGIGMLRSARDGILLYLIMLFSAMLTGFLFRPPSRRSESDLHAPAAEVPVSRSIFDAGGAMLGILSFILAFSALLAPLRLLIRSPRCLALVATLLEVSNAVHYIIAAGFSRRATLALISFAVSFSGLSVHLQSAAFLTPVGISQSTHTKMKITEGAIAGLLSLLFLS